MEFAIIRVVPFLTPKGLDPCYKMDLDFWDCFGRKKLCQKKDLYNQRNTVFELLGTYQLKTKFVGHKKDIAKKTLSF